MTAGRAEVPGQEAGSAPHRHHQCCSHSRADPVQSKDLPSQTPTLGNMVPGSKSVKSEYPGPWCHRPGR